jgi:hypothetical protein
MRTELPPVDGMARATESYTRRNEIWGEKTGDEVQGGGRIMSNPSGVENIGVSKMSF